MILLDPRAGSRDLAAHIKPKSVVRTAKIHLPTDVMFIGSGPSGPVQVGIEHKQISDVLQCIGDGRFAGYQLGEAKRNVDVFYLMVEGIFRRSPENATLEIFRQGRWLDTKEAFFMQRVWMYDDLAAWLMSMETLANVRLRYTSSKPESGRMIKQMYDWWTKDWEDHHSLHTFHEVGAPMLQDDYSLIQRVAKELPGIGWTSASACEETFNSTYEMINAPAGVWSEILIGGKNKRKRRIGVKTAKTIVNAIHGKEPAKK